MRVRHVTCPRPNKGIHIKVWDAVWVAVNQVSPSVALILYHAFMCVCNSSV